MDKTNNKKNVNKIVDLKKTLAGKITIIKNKFKEVVRKQKNPKINIYMKNKIDYKTLTISQIEAELNRTTYNEKYVKILKSTIYSLIIVAAVATIIATLIMPVLQISGTSMAPTFNEGEIVLSLKTKNLETGDIIAFYHGNKILIKRIIAGAGSYVNIDEEGNVYVNGNLIDEPYIKEKTLGDYNITFPYQVPDGKWFVLGDHRSISIDSRNSEIGCIEQENIVGKIVFRVWPLKEFGKIN